VERKHSGTIDLTGSLYGDPGVRRLAEGLFADILDMFLGCSDCDRTCLGTYYGVAELVRH
jgi:hypothetical protein